MAKRKTKVSFYGERTVEVTLTQEVLDKMEVGGKDWKTPCDNCGETPTVHPTGLCGPCCFGEAGTMGGNW